MKKYTFLLIVIFQLLITKNANGQFEIIMNKADSLRMLKGDLQGSVEAYAELVAKEPDNKMNLYNYACNLTLLRRYDKAFEVLKQYMQKELDLSPFSDSDFLGLRNDKRWDSFEDSVMKVHAATFPGRIKDYAYARALMRMKAKDQAYYDILKITDQQYGPSSSVSLAIWDLKDRLNEENQKELEAWITKKGWPKLSEIGGGSDFAFFIIQHSDLSLQEKYLPIIKLACENNEAHWSNYAYLYDRVQVSKKKPQRYGTQVKIDPVTNKKELCPLEDAVRINEIRRKVGLGPIENYVKQFGIEFNPEK